MKHNICRKLIGTALAAAAGCCLLTSCASLRRDAPGNVLVYQLAPENVSLMMSYVIVTHNRKVVVIDGGIAGQGEGAQPYLPSAIRAILGLKQGEYFEVEAWFLSHGHNDHFNELGKMLAEYLPDDNYRINNIYFDFPDFGVEWSSRSGEADYSLKDLAKFKRGLDSYYSLVGFRGLSGADIPEDKWEKPEGSENYYYDLLNGAVINRTSVDEGLTIDVDGVSFRVLTTWSEASQNVNSTSVVVRMTYGEHSVLFLGDAYIDTGNELMSRYTPEELHSEYVQPGHHGQSGPSREFYDYIDAAHSKRLWPTPYWVWNVYEHASLRTDVTRSWLGLPADYAEFEAQGLLEAGNDFVAGLYKHYPSEPANVSYWTREVLNDQLVASFKPV